MLPILLLSEQFRFTLIASLNKDWVYCKLDDGNEFSLLKDDDVKKMKYSLVRHYLSIPTIFTSLFNMSLQF